MGTFAIISMVLSMEPQIVAFMQAILSALGVLNPEQKGVAVAHLNEQAAAPDAPDWAKLMGQILELGPDLAAFIVGVIGAFTRLTPGQQQLAKQQAAAVLNAPPPVVTPAPVAVACNPPPVGDPPPVVGR